MEQVLRQVTSELDSFTYLILDLKRVLQIDECARALLAQTNEMLKLRGKALLLAHLAEHSADLSVERGQSGLFTDIDSSGVRIRSCSRNNPSSYTRTDKSRSPRWTSLPASIIGKSA